MDSIRDCYVVLSDLAGCPSVLNQFGLNLKDLYEPAIGRQENSPASVLDHQHRREQFSENTLKKGVSCTVCNKQFIYQHRLNEHIRSVHEKPYICEICDKRFGSPSHLKKHVEAMHDPSKGIFCDICRRRSKNQRRFAIHLKRNPSCDVSGTVPEQAECMFCDICRKRLKNQSSLARHLKQNPSCDVSAAKTSVRRIKRLRATYVCSCGESFVGTERLITHSLEDSRHSCEKGNGYACPICDKTVSLLSMLPYHIRYNHGVRKHACNKCDMRYYYPIQLKYHMYTHSSADELERFACSLCERKFPENKLLDKHVFRCHGGWRYACDKCGKKCIDLSALTCHLRKHDPSKNFVCEICNKRFKHGNSLSRHLKCHANLQHHTCEICHAKLLTNDGFNSHMKAHLGEKVTCNECFKSFPNKHSLQNHLKTHAEKGQYTCNECGAMFKLRNTLKAHAAVHISEKRFSCTKCGTSYKSKVRLRRHEISFHTELKLFSCDICHKRFPRQCHLNEHARKHADERPFPCLECGMSFKRRNHLDIHQRTHSKPFGCNTCGKSFSLNRSLVVHQRSHTNERPFSCSHCGKTFTCVFGLNRHVKVMHAAVRPCYKCRVCEQPLASISSRARHELTHLSPSEQIKNEQSKEQSDGTGLICKCCTKPFPSICRLKQHLQWKAGCKSTTVRCEHCNRSLSSKKALTYHMKSCRCKIG